MLWLTVWPEATALWPKDLTNRPPQRNERGHLARQLHKTPQPQRLLLLDMNEQQVLNQRNVYWSTYSNTDFITVGRCTQPWKEWRMVKLSSVSFQNSALVVFSFPPSFDILTFPRACPATHRPSRHCSQSPGPSHWCWGKEATNDNLIKLHLSRPHSLSWSSTWGVNTQPLKSFKCR